MLLPRDPVNIVRQPVHDLQLAGLPGNICRFLLLCLFMVEGANQLAVAKNVAVGIPDGKVTLRSFLDGIPSGLDQRVMTALILLRAAFLQPGGKDPMEIVDKIFEPGEIPQIAIECLKLAGYIDGVKVVDDIKN